MGNSAEIIAMEIKPIAVADDASLRLILDTALDAAIVLGPDGTIRDWNTVAEHVFGWQRSEILGSPMAERIIPERFRRDHDRGFGHYLLTGEGPLLRKRVETTALRRSGEEFPIELSISPLTRHGKTLFLGFVRDISETHRAHALLQTQARRAELLQRLTSAAAENASVDQVLQLCLDAVCEFIDWSVGHAYLPSGSEPVELVPTAIWHCPAGRYKILRQVTEQTRFKLGEGLPGCIWKTKEPFWISDVQQSPFFPRARMAPVEIRAAFGFPIRSGEEVIAILEFFHDLPQAPDESILLTARALGDQLGRAIERQREKDRQQLLQTELTHANRVATMGQLTASIAHEINQPITAAITYSNAALRWLCARPPNLEEVRDALRSILESSVRAGEVIGRVRALAKKSPPRKDRVEINEVVLEVIALIRHEIVKSGILVQTQLAETLPRVKGDRVQLQQVILNLLINAIEAMSVIGEVPRELVISSEEAEDGVLVTVRDSGPGLPPHSVEKVLEAFYTTKPDGLGMGLSICHSIIEAHQGKLWARAKEPRGAVFHFTLPAYDFSLD